MSDYYANTPQGKDPYMWELAQKRASFKYHLAAYIIIIGSMWAFWLVAGRGYTDYPWPVWPTFGWGIGLTFHFLGAFVFSKNNSVEKEYEKLMQNKK